MRRFGGFALALCVSCLIAGSVNAARPSQDKTEDVGTCKARLLMEAGSGEILVEENSHLPLPPASMVKLMVAYVTLKKVQQGAATLDDVITASGTASKIGGSQVYLKEHEQFKLGQLLEAVLIQSANDASYAIAEYLGGSPEGFVDLMNEEASNLGMTEAEFHSPHGLPPAKGQSPDLVSASNMAILARALLREFPQVLEWTGKAEGPFRDGAFIMRNHNHLINSFAGCDGLKTGFYNDAGFCITTTAKRNDTRLIAVVMGCKGRKERDAEAARLMSTGFAQYRSVKLAKKGASAESAVAISGGTIREVVPVLSQDVNGVVKRGEESKVMRKVSLCQGLAAPVAANTPCGFISFLLGERQIAKVDLVVAEPVPAGGITTKLWRLIGK